MAFLVHADRSELDYGLAEEVDGDDSLRYLGGSARGGALRRTGERQCRHLLQPRRVMGRVRARLWYGRRLSPRLRITSGTGALAGKATYTPGAAFANITGSLSRDHVKIITTYIGMKYVATFTGTVESSGDSMSGNYSIGSSSKAVGPWSADRIVKGNKPPPSTLEVEESSTVERHGVATAVTYSGQVNITSVDAPYSKTPVSSPLHDAARNACLGLYADGRRDGVTPMVIFYSVEHGQDVYLEITNRDHDPTKWTSSGQWTDDSDVAPGLKDYPDNKVFAVGAFFPKNSVGEYILNEPYDSEIVDMRFQGYPIAVTCDDFVVERTVEELGR